MPLRLVDVLSGAVVFTRPAGNKPLLVGRLQVPTCTGKAVRMAGISRQHFFIEWPAAVDPGGAGTEALLIRDNNSVNGIAVNRKRVVEACLSVGDLIAVGLGRHVKVGEVVSPHDKGLKSAWHLRVEADKRLASAHAAQASRSPCTGKSANNGSNSKAGLGCVSALPKSTADNSSNSHQTHSKTFGVALSSQPDASTAHPTAESLCKSAVCAETIANSSEVKCTSDTRSVADGAVTALSAHNASLRAHGIRGLEPQSIQAQRTAGVASKSAHRTLPSFLRKPIPAAEMSADSKRAVSNRRANAKRKNNMRTTSSASKKRTRLRNPKKIVAENSESDEALWPSDQSESESEEEWVASSLSLPSGAEGHVRNLRQEAETAHQADNPIQETVAEAHDAKRKTETVLLTVVAQNGAETMFRVRAHGRLRKMINAYCAKEGYKKAECTFSYRGKELRDEDRPFALGIASSDRINFRRLDTQPGAVGVKQRPIGANSHKQHSFENVEQGGPRCCGRKKPAVPIAKKAATLLEKAIVAIRAKKHACYSSTGELSGWSGCSRQAIQKHLIAKLGAKSKPAITRALAKGVQTKVLHQQKQSFWVVEDESIVDGVVQSETDDSSS